MIIKKYKKKLLLLLKIAVSLIFILIVIKNIDVSKIILQFKKSRLDLIILGVLLFTISQALSSHRLKNIFHAYHFLIHPKSNLMLYFIGMFYNYFIPGGVGGDAYKVYKLKKSFDWKLKTLFEVVFLDRLIGLMAIISLILFFLPIFFNSNGLYIIVSIIVNAILCIGGYQFVKFYFKKFKFVYIKSFLVSYAVQLLQGASFLSFIVALGGQSNFLAYIVLFYISSVLSMLSFAGIGTREFIFLKATDYFIYNTEIGIASALTFNVVTALISLVGVIFIVIRPKLLLSQKMS